MLSQNFFAEFWTFMWDVVYQPIGPLFKISTHLIMLSSIHPTIILIGVSNKTYYNLFHKVTFDIQTMLDTVRRQQAISKASIHQKTSSYGYRNPHCKPKKFWRPSQVHSGL